MNKMKQLAFVLIGAGFVGSGLLLVLRELTEVARLEFAGLTGVFVLLCGLLILHESLQLFRGRANKIVVVTIGVSITLTGVFAIFRGAELTQIPGLGSFLLALVVSFIGVIYAASAFEDDSHDSNETASLRAIPSGRPEKRNG